jgi:hypothetical protein
MTKPATLTFRKMTTITDTAAISAAFDKLSTDGDPAYCTCRCLPGQYEQENCQEWAEHNSIDGVPVKVYYMFDNEDCESEDCGGYPWDADHVTHIEIAEKDEDGDFDNL